MKYVLVFNQHRGLKDFWSSFMRELVRRKHELVEQAVSVQPHPAGDSSGMPKYALLSGINLEKPLTHCDSLLFFSVFSSAVQLHTLPA